MTRADPPAGKVDLLPCWTCRATEFVEITHSSQKDGWPLYRCLNCKAVYPERALVVTPEAMPEAGERCGDNGKLCPACSLPAHELTQVPGCGGPLPPEAGGVGEEPPYRFERYRNGKRMAEGVRINAATSLDEAIAKAVGLIDHDEPGTVLVYRPHPPAPAVADVAGRMANFAERARLHGAEPEDVQALRDAADMLAALAPAPVDDAVTQEAGECFEHLSPEPCKYCAQIERQRPPVDPDGEAREIATAVMRFLRPQLRQMISFETLCEAIEPPLRRALQARPSGEVREAALRMAASVCATEAIAAEKQIAHYDSYSGPEMPARKAEVHRCGAARACERAILALIEPQQVTP